MPILKDRFGNEIDPTIGYARGTILRSSIEENYKALWCRELVRKRIDQKGIKSIINMQPTSAVFPITEEDLKKATEDYTGPAFYQKQLDKLALEFMGGNSERHSVTFFCRTTTAIISTILTFAKKGTKVVSFTPPLRSHSSITFGTRFAGAQLVETLNISDFKESLSKEVSLIIITGVSVIGKKMSNEDLKEAVRLTRKQNIPILLDDASGGGYRPVLWGGPKSLELDVDVAVKSVQKAAMYGPRAGILAGRKEAIDSIAALGYQLGMDIRAPIAVAIMRALENYDPEEVKRSKEYCDELYDLALKRFGKRRLETMDIGGIQFSEEDCLGILMERTKKGKPVITPQEASVSVAMALQEDYGIMTLPARAGPGCSWALKVAPFYSEHAKMKSEEIIDCIDASFDRVSKICTERGQIARLLFGSLFGE